MNANTTNTSKLAHTVAPKAKKKLAAASTAIPPEPTAHTPSVLDAAQAEWVDKINQRLRDGLEAWIEAGKDLTAAKKELGHGGFGAMFKLGLVGIDQRTAERLMRVAGHPALSNPTNWSILPQSIKSLDALAALDAPVIEQAIIAQELNPGMTITGTRNFVRLKTGEVVKQPVREESSRVTEPEPVASAASDNETSKFRKSFDPQSFTHALAQFLEAECAKYPRQRAVIRRTATEVCAKFFRRRKASNVGSIGRTSATGHVDTDRPDCPPAEQPSTLKQRNCAAEESNGGDTSTASSAVGTTLPVFRKTFPLSDAARTQLERDLSTLTSADPTSGVYGDALRRVHESGNYLAVAGSFDAFCDKVLRREPAEVKLALEGEQSASEPKQPELPPPAPAHMGPKPQLTLKEKIALSKQARQMTA